MRTYTAWWLLVWAAITSFGVLLGLLLVPPSTAILTLVLVAAAAAALSAAQAQLKSGGQALPRGRAWTACVHGARAGLIAVALTGVGAVSSALMLLLLLAAGGSSPWLLRAILGDTPSLLQTRKPGSAPEAAVSADAIDPMSAHRPARRVLTELPSDLATLSDADLCQAWRFSFTVLGDARSVAARGHVVTVRQTYLDELERRHPTGMQAWLTSGARAAGNPTRYLAEERLTSKQDPQQTAEQTAEQRMRPPVSARTDAEAPGGPHDVDDHDDSGS